MQQKPININASNSVLETTASGFTLVMTSVRKHWPMVVACIAILAGASVIFTKSQRKEYEATITLEINPHIEQPLGDDKTRGVIALGAENYFEGREYIETQYKKLVSNRVLGAVVRDMGLAQDPDFGGHPGAPATPDALQTAIQILRNSRIKIEPIKESHLTVLRVTDYDPARVARLADAIGNTFIDENLRTAVNSSGDAVVWLNGQVDHVQKDLESSEDALHEFKEKNQLPSTSINDASNMVRMEMQGYGEALTRTRTHRAEISARYTQLSQVTDDNPDALPASELLRDEFLSTARESYAGAVKERDSLLAEGKGTNHPLVRRSDEQVQSAKAALLAQIRNIKGALERDLAVVKNEEGQEATLLESSRKVAVDLNMKEIEYRRLDRSREQNEKLYGFLLERLKEADLARMMRVNNISVIDPAVAPSVPVRPRMSVNLGIGLALGVLLGVFLAWARDQLDVSIKVPEDIEEKLGAPFLGLLPQLGSDAPRRGLRRSKTLRMVGEVPELALHRAPRSGFAESARSIRTNLMFMNPDEPFRSIVVTSAAPAEGKTMVACSIALAFAQGGQRTCIIDCDLRRPRLHRIFGRAGDAGVTNVLVGDATIDDVALQTECDNLWSIPAGPMPPNPADVVHSDRFKQFIRDVSLKFDRVIIDSPPLVAVTDGAIISKLVQGTVFVVRAFKTSKYMCRQALRALRDVEAPLLGVVLNAVDLNRLEYAYNYYYYAYYKKEGYAPVEPPVEPPTEPPQSSASAPN